MEPRLGMGVGKTGTLIHWKIGRGGNHNEGKKERL